MERGLLEIYRFVPPPLLETFDPETIDDVDEFLGWVAKARFMQELEEGIVTPGDRASVPRVTASRRRSFSASISNWR